MKTNVSLGSVRIRKYFAISKLSLSSGVSYQNADALLALGMLSLLALQVSRSTSTAQYVNDGEFRPGDSSFEVSLPSLSADASTSTTAAAVQESKLIDEQIEMGEEETIYMKISML